MSHTGFAECPVFGDLRRRAVAELIEAWVGEELPASTEVPLAAFSRWGLTVSAGGGAGLVTDSANYGPFAAMSGGGAGGGAILETVVPVAKRLAETSILFDFDVAIGATDLGNAVVAFGLRDGSDDFCQFAYDGFVSAQWRVQAREGSTTSSVPLALHAPDTALYPNHRFSIVLRGADVGDACELYIDGAPVYKFAGAAGPRASAHLSAYFAIANDGANSPEMKVGAGALVWTL